MRADNAVMKADMAYGVDPVAKEGDEMPSYGKTSEKYGQLNLISMMEVDYYDVEKWNAFMDQTTWEEHFSPRYHGRARHSRYRVGRRAGRQKPERTLGA